MTQKKRKVLLILVGIIVLVFFSPFIFFKSHTVIDTEINSEKNSKGSTTNVNLFKKGIDFGNSVVELESKAKFKTTKSSVINLGLYLRITKEISFQKYVDNQIENIIVKAESDIWGLGKSRAKMNSFNKIFENRIEEILKNN